MIPPLEASTMKNLIEFWVPPDRIPTAVWISIFLILPILFNFFNVRRYGEIEFWLASVKVITVTGLIVLGILLPMGASSTRPLLGHNGTEPAQCSEFPDDCVEQPGFYCNALSKMS